MRLICLLLVYANICCAKTFFFGGSVDVALEWPLQPSFDPKIEVFCDSNDHISSVNNENSIITCLNSDEEETTLHLRIKYSDEQDQEGNTYHSVLQKLQATQFLLVESQKEEVDQFIIPPPPYSSLESTIPLTSEDSITLSLKPGFHKVSLHAFHCSAIGQLHKQCTPLTNFPRQIFFVNTFGERTKLFQKSLQTKLAEKMGETRQISSGYKTMSNLYKNYRLHSDIFSFDKKFIDNQLLDFISGNAKLSDVVHPVTQTGIYMLHVFTPEFCQKLIEEVDNYENFLVSNNIDPNEHRPNFLNKFGHLLDEMGLQSFLDDVMDQVLSKITSLLFYEWGGDSLDSHHGFVVEYQGGAKDIDLEYHMDQAEVTLNLCLGKEFEGGSVFFNGIREHWSTEQLHSESFEFHHIPGAALLHIGQHWHGANKIQYGERYNLILWMRSSKYHQSLAEQYWEQEENSSGKINFQNIDVI